MNDERNQFGAVAQYQVFTLLTIIIFGNVPRFKKKKLVLKRLKAFLNRITRGLAGISRD